MYRYTTTVAFPPNSDEDGPEFDVEVTYTVARGTPESGRTGPPENYDPGSPDEIEDFKLVKCDGKERPWNAGYGFISDEDWEERVREKIDDDDLLRNANETDEANGPD